MSQKLRKISFCFVVFFIITVLGENVHGFSKDINAYANSFNYYFIENKGQIIDQNNKPNTGVLYLLNTPGFNVQLRRDGFSYDVYQVHSQQSTVSNNLSRVSRLASRDSNSVIAYHRIDFDLLNTNPDPVIEASGLSSDYLNYYCVYIPITGIKNIRQYKNITYKNIYPNIDLEFVTNESNQYKYNFIIHPGGKVGDIRLKISGPDRIAFTKDSLLFHTSVGAVKEQIPVSYFLSSNSFVGIQVSFRRISENVFGFSVDQLVPENSILTLDPTSIRLWGTYYGGYNSEWGYCVAVDSMHNTFLTGTTQSPNNIATIGAYQTTKKGILDNGYLVKFNANGIRQWGTYYGGDSNGYVRTYGCITDIAGNVYIAGTTSADSGIVTPGAHQTIFGGGGSDAFLAKFNPNGIRLWATYYGGEGPDQITRPGVTTDKYCNVYICGGTGSNLNIATSGAYQETMYPGASGAAFIAKLDSSGVRLWGTYYGGENGATFNSCSCDTIGNFYATGFTESTLNIASTGAFQTLYGGGISDACLVAFTSTGQRLWGTYFGGNLQDNGTICTVDHKGFIYFGGWTTSTTGIASLGSYQSNLGGGIDGFIAKFNNLGQRRWSSYYGGTLDDWVYGFSTSNNGDSFISGITQSVNGIATPNSYMSTYGGGFRDAFLIKFDSIGQRNWGTYFGDVGDDRSTFCTYMTDDTIYFTGISTSINNIATPGAHQTIFGGASDAILEKFIDCWPIDTVGPITGPVNVCKPSTGINYSIPPLAHVVDYVWTLPAGFTLMGGAGTPGITVDINNSAASGTIWVKGLNKCNDPGDSAYLYVTVSQAPVPVISGPNNTCASSGKVYSTDPGKTNYQWSISAGGVITSGGTTSDNTVTVTWNVVGTQHVYVNYTDANGCSADIPTDYNVTVTPSPAVNITITATSNNVCSGTQVTFNSTASNGGGNPFYQWQVNGSSIGANSSSFSYTPFNNDLVRCILTSSITGCIMNNPDTSNTIIMIVNTILPVSVLINASENPFCQGSTITFTATPVNEGTAPFYQWKVNGIIVGPNNPVYSFVPNNGDLVSCVLNSSIPCPTGNPAISNSITMIENTNVTVSVSIAPSANPVCAGTSVTFTAFPINGGTTPVYQWKVNGIIVGANNPIYSYIPANGDVITCILTSNALCASGNPATSNAVTMIVNPLNPITVTISPSANPVCSGTNVTYIAIPVNGGTTPVYQWKVNGVIVGTNNPIYSYTPVNGDIVTCVLTSNILCPIGNPATSNTITMTVNPNLPVSIAISASANPFCQGASVTFTATPTNGGATPSYQWKVNGINIGSNNPVYSYSPNNGDIVSCVLTSDIECPIGNPAASNSITMIVNANLPAGINIAASANPFCPGNSVTFTATPMNGGANPAYQWKVNGGNSGTNSSIFTYNPISLDQVSCIMTSNLVCVTGNPATSNTIIMSGTLASIVTLTLCNDTITTTNAKPFKLKGGIPLGGIYSGAGVAGGIFNPAIAGMGNHQINYTYTNAALCSATAHSFLHIFNPLNLPCGSQLTDIRDNKTYSTVQIGNQCWMAANLNYGTLIPGNTSQRDNCIWEKYCYNDVTANCGQQTYYQWDELMQYDETVSTQGLCPPGWHVPTEADWNILFTNYISNGFAGSPLKYSGFSGFNAILSGARHMNKTWDYQGFATFFWSSTSHGVNKAWAHGMNDIDPSVSIYHAFRSNAMSVRCVHD